MLHTAALAPPPPRDPTRAALAEAIQARDALRDEIDALQAAELTSRDAIRACRRAQQAAEVGVTHAKEAAAGASLARVLGRQDDVAPPLSTARRMLTDAEDLLDVAQRAETQRAARLSESLQSLSGTQRRVEDGVARVLANSDAAKALTENVGRLQREMLDATQALAWLMSKSAVRWDASLSAVARDTLEQAPIRLRTPPQLWQGLLHHTVVAGAQPWEAVFAALCADADAVLPS